MAYRKYSIIQWASALLSIGFGWGTALLPLPVSRRLADALAVVAFYVVPRIRKIGYANLDLAYGDELSAAEKRRILLGCVKNVARVAVEFSLMPSLGKGKYPDLISVEGYENYDPDVPVLGISAHIGNWEWMALAMARKGLTVAEMVRPLDNPVLNKVVDETRCAGGIMTFPQKKGGPEAIRLLREGIFVGVLVDQSVADNGVPTTFFGQRCWSTVAPMIISMRARVPVVPVAMHRREDNGYVLRFYPQVEMQRTKDMHQDLLVNIQRCQDAVEAMVRESPEQWMWIHNRWKPRPHLDKAWAEKLARREERGMGKEKQEV